MVLNQAEFERIRQGSKVLTDVDRRELEETARSNRNARLDASNARKAEMQALETQRKMNEKPSDLEQVGGNYFACVAACANHRIAGIFRGVKLSCRPLRFVHVLLKLFEGVIFAEFGPVPTGN